MYDLDNDMFYLRHKKQILKEGFHACSNHPDIYAHFVRFIHALNFRGYFIVLDKTSEYFKKITTTKTPDLIYNDCIIKLLRDRLIKRKLDINHLVFEQNLSNPSPGRLEKRKLEIINLIDELNEDFAQRGLIRNNIKFSIELATKTENILSIVDYVSHVLCKVFEGKNGKVENFMKENYQLIEPKIACIHLVDKNIYIKTRNRSLDIDNVLIK
jgi:hypothetical protein